MEVQPIVPPQRNQKKHIPNFLRRNSMTTVKVPPSVRWRRVCMVSDSMRKVLSLLKRRMITVRLVLVTRLRWKRHTLPLRRWLIPTMTNRRQPIRARLFQSRNIMPSMQRQRLHSALPSCVPAQSSFPARIICSMVTWRHKRKSTRWRMISLA